MFATLALAAVGATVPSVYAAAAGQPSHAGTGPGTWEIVGTTGVSAQQMFLGTDNKVYIIDKTQNNPATINGHPAWATGESQSTSKPASPLAMPRLWLALFLSAPREICRDIRPGVIDLVPFGPLSRLRLLYDAVPLFSGSHRVRY